MRFIRVRPFWLKNTQNLVLVNLKCSIYITVIIIIVVVVVIVIIINIISVISFTIFISLFYPYITLTLNKQTLPVY